MYHEISVLGQGSYEYMSTCPMSTSTSAFYFGTHEYEWSMGIDDSVPTVLVPQPTAWMSDYIRLFYMGVIIYPCCHPYAGVANLLEKVPGLLVYSLVRCNA